MTKCDSCPEFAEAVHTYGNQKLPSGIYSPTKIVYLCGTCGAQLWNMLAPIVNMNHVFYSVESIE